MPPGASGAKAQSSYPYGQPGQLFSVQPKTEASPSMCNATTVQTWRIMENLNLGPQPKTAQVPFSMGQTASSSSSSAPSSSAPSTTTSALNQAYPTVNLSDLNEFFPNISSAIGPDPVGPQGGPSQCSSSFGLQGSQFRMEASIGVDDIPEFPSFPESQAPGTLENLNMDDLEDLLNPNLMSESGSGASMLAQASCQQSASSSSGVQNSTAAQNNCDPSSMPGSAWMNYPSSIVSLLQNDSLSDMASGSNHRPPVLDELDELMSADEDRLISIFNSGSQARFVSGHPT